MTKTTVLLVALGLAFGTTAASAADTKPAAKAMPMKSATAMPMKSHKIANCYDMAWQSQDQKDCLAKYPDGVIKASMSGSKAKASAKKS